MRLTETKRRTTRIGRGYIDDARSRRVGYYAVPCASAGHRWLKRPPEGEKKRGGWRQERRVVVAAERAREESETRERESSTQNELGFRWDTGRWGRGGLYTPPPPTGTSNGRDERGRQINGSEQCRSRAGLFSRAVPRPALQADLVAQARHYGRAVPGTGTMLARAGRAFSVPCLGQPIVLVPNEKI